MYRNTVLDYLTCVKIHNTSDNIHALHDMCKL